MRPPTDVGETRAPLEEWQGSRLEKVFRLVTFTRPFQQSPVLYFGLDDNQKQKASRKPFSTAERFARVIL